MFDKNMLAYCGIYCGLCSYKTAHDENDGTHIDAVPYAFEKRELKAYACGGCRSGQCIRGKCAIAKCASQKSILSCADCENMPCDLISEFENDGMPHHRDAVLNLREIKASGTENWYENMKLKPRCACGKRQSWYLLCDEHKI